MTEPDPFEIVLYEPHYRPGVLTVVEQIHREEGAEPFDPETEDDLRDVEASYGPPDGKLLVAFFEGQVVGVGGICRVSETECELRRLGVLADFRRKGIATTLVGMLFDFVRERGYRRVLLEREPHMDPQLRRYTRFGFEPVPPGDKLPRPGDFLALSF